jgi:hypothetical protein
MYYMTRKSHGRHKHKFSVMCPGTLFLKSILVPPELENSAITFRTLDAWKCT